MRFSEQWLREWIDPPVDTDELCRQLTMAGLEVDAVAPAAPSLENVVVGAVEAVEPHPEADKLSVCTVDCGKHGRRTIVCGAANVRPGLHTPAALPGARLPDGTEIAETELRGVRSAGMLCGAPELGLGDEDGGILELDADAPAGILLSEHLRLDDQVVEVDLTPNRGDCLSLRGIAREVGVWNRLPVARPSVDALAAVHDRSVAVEIQDTDDCPAYAGRVVTGIDPAARTPDWMRERLRRGGIRPIFPVVDVTNYVMLELGQPMHAFDLGRLSGNIRVRRAAQGESLVLLDGTEMQLDSSTLTIADDSGPLAMAGIMGGESSAVGGNTRDIFLESACFSPRVVAGQGRRYKIHTDSLHRFERGVDPALQALALERATALILAIAGGEPGPVVHAGTEATQRPHIHLRRARVAHLLGTEVPDEEIVDILERLEIVVAPDAEVDGWQVRPPSHRYDLALEADLIEEVARIHGYDKLPSQRRAVFAPIAAESETRRPLDAAREVLRQRGYDEAITYSFVDPELQARLNPDAAAVDLDNPIAEGYAQMRTTLWSGLIPCWLYNVRRQRPRVRIFEHGLRFTCERDADFGIAQRAALAGLAYGSAALEHWDGSQRPLDFFDVKGDVEALLASVEGEVSFRAGTHPALHPGRSAAIRVDDKNAGWIGQLHPEFGRILDVKKLPYLFELEWEILETMRFPRYRLVSDLPEVRRDLALSVPESVAAGELLEALRSADESLLQQAFVFDVFRGGDLEKGFKSVALGLIFQHKTRTLETETVDSAVARLTALLEKRFEASVRGT